MPTKMHFFSSFHTPFVPFNQTNGALVYDIPLNYEISSFNEVPFVKYWFLSGTFNIHDEIVKFFTFF